MSLFGVMQSEKQSVCLQLERVEKELRLSHEQSAALTGKLHKAEREINALNIQVPLSRMLENSHRQTLPTSSAVLF